MLLMCFMALTGVYACLCTCVVAVGISVTIFWFIGSTTLSVNGLTQLPVWMGIETSVIILCLSVYLSVHCSKNKLSYLGSVDARSQGMIAASSTTGLILQGRPRSVLIVIFYVWISCIMCCMAILSIWWRMCMLPLANVGRFLPSQLLRRRDIKSSMKKWSQLQGGKVRLKQYIIE